MTTKPPPKFYFSGIIFNSEYYQDEDTTGFTQDQADLRYLKKNITDTATVLETFNAGIKTNSIESVLTTDVSNILINSTGNINIGTSASRTTSNPIIIGNSSNTIIRLGSTGLSFSTAGTPTATLQSIATSGILIQTPAAAFNLLNNHTGILNIGTSTTRTGNINIANTQTTGTGNIILGSNVLTGSGTQNITINRPLTIGYTTLPTLTDLGYYVDYTNTSQAITSGSNNIIVFIPIETSGLYIVNIQMKFTIGATAIRFTRQRFGIQQSIGTYLNNLYTSTIGTYDMPLTGEYVDSTSGIYRFTGATNYNLVCDSLFTLSTLSAIGNVIITRIG